jgi:hypothetical protein
MVTFRRFGTLPSGGIMYCYVQSVIPILKIVMAAHARN